MFSFFIDVQVQLSPFLHQIIVVLVPRLRDPFRGSQQKPAIAVAQKKKKRKEKKRKKRKEDLVNLI